MNLGRNEGLLDTDSGTLYWPMLDTSAIEDAALSLPPRERAYLAARLMASLVPHLPTADGFDGDQTATPEESANQSPDYPELASKPSSTMSLEDFRKTFGR